MSNVLLYGVIILLAGIILLLALSKNKKPEVDLQAIIETMSKGQNEELEKLRGVLDAKMTELRDNNEGKLEKIKETLDSKISGLTESNQAKLAELGENSDKKLEKINATLDEKITTLSEANQTKLDKMNETVGDKLQTHIKESFKTVTERLESVNKTVGEISGLTGDVKDLRKLFGGVKTRGVWGEAQLRAIIEQLLTKDQYRENVATKPRSSERVEFAIVMPGQEETQLLLPVDSKCPIEDYAKIIEASQKGDAAELETARKALRARVVAEAKDIRDKYIEVPYTTDFGILFAPVEGLFVEILGLEGLYGELLEKYKVIPAGPSTFAALVSSLRIGFRTLQIQKKTKEIEQLLGKVKTEFEKYGAVIEKTSKHIASASNELESISVRNKKIVSSLKNIDALPVSENDFETEE